MKCAIVKEETKVIINEKETMKDIEKELREAAVLTGGIKDEDGYYDDYYENEMVDLEIAIDIVKKSLSNAIKPNFANKNNGWIPCEVQMPNEGTRVLVWYEYFRYGEYNCVYQTCGIGYQYDGRWNGDVSGTKARCIAWQPLPDPYTPKKGAE